MIEAADTIVEMKKSINKTQEILSELKKSCEIEKSTTKPQDLNSQSEGFFFFFFQSKENNK